MHKSTTTKNNKIGFVSLGCPKALIDSEVLINILRNEGYVITPNYQDADLVIINTCGFINAAIQESLDAIAEALKANGKVMITGCLGKDKKMLKEKYPQLLHVSGPNKTSELLKAVHQYLAPPENPNILKPGESIERKLRLTPQHYAYLKIAEGCNNRCRFCIIPKLRGRLKSRPQQEIVKEAKQLVQSGVKEIIIIAQDTLAYGSDLKYGKTDIFTLLQELTKLNVWIRLHYLYPYPKLDQIVELMAQEKIIPYIDVPLQHVNERILKLMRRPGTKEKLLERISKWRATCPNIAIRSSFIVGFPGETRAEFNELIDFLKQARLDHVGCFTYSAVKGAAANQLPNQVTAATKKRRIEKLMLTQQQISAEILQTKISQKLTVIVDSIKPTSKIAIARSFADAPEIDGKVIIDLNTVKKKISRGEILEVTITGSDNYDLYVSTPHL